MKVHTQNIFKYSNIRYFELSKNPISTEKLKLKLISKRTKFGKFFKNLENLLNGENCNISIFDCNKYGYVSLILDIDDKFEQNKIDFEKIGYRSNY